MHPWFPFPGALCHVLGFRKLVSAATFGHVCRSTSLSLSSRSLSGTFVLQCHCFPNFERWWKGAPATQGASTSSKKKKNQQKLRSLHVNVVHCQHRVWILPPLPLMGKVGCCPSDSNTFLHLAEQAVDATRLAVVEKESRVQAPLAACSSHWKPSPSGCAHLLPPPPPPPPPPVPPPPSQPFSPPHPRLQEGESPFCCQSSRDTLTFGVGGEGRAARTRHTCNRLRPCHVTDCRDLPPCFDYPSGWRCLWCLWGVAMSWSCRATAGSRILACLGRLVEWGRGARRAWWLGLTLPGSAVEGAHPALGTLQTFPAIATLCFTLGVRGPLAFLGNMSLSASQ